MSGIVVADFESLIRNSELRISDVSDDLQKLRSASLDLRRSIRNSDLSFLTENLYFEVNEGSKMINKLNGYRMTLRNVLRSYQYQEQRVAATVRRFTPWKLYIEGGKGRYDRI